MKKREDSEERRDFSQCLLHVVAGLMSLDELRGMFHGTDLAIRQVNLSSGAVRFVVTERRNGRVWDSFTYYGEESLGALGLPNDFEEE